METELLAAGRAARAAQSVAAMAGPLQPQAARTVDLLSDLADDHGARPGDFAAGLVEAWRAIALYGDADILRLTLPGEIDIRLADTSGGRVRAAELATMVAALSLASVRGTYAAEQDASRARAVLASATTPVLELAAGLGADTHGWLSALTGEAALALSRTAANRAPLVRVETPVSLSAIRLAHDLYGDAARAGEIVARNRAPAAAIMPVVIEAISR